MKRSTAKTVRAAFEGFNRSTIRPVTITGNPREQSIARIRSYIALIDRCLLGHLGDFRNPFTKAVEVFNIRKATGRDYDEPLLYRRELWERALARLGAWP